ncbi:hypothetical protein O3597_19345 [Verrucosispora sp. WMMA2044]|uniref:hypothetical protein n=1 Tax=Verrucosispora sp. WMMA2044 TaxID=3016419 RepID=UPI00248B85DB|nr:hypothetical protein [Verrucosispora sp. WMMA2044]WBB47294.1 hypothetical protein O3597_19345 [Verrucosispora sp. WMMA2044]
MNRKVIAVVLTVVLVCLGSCCFSGGVTIGSAMPYEWQLPDGDKPPADKKVGIMGHVAYQPPLLPVQFVLNSDGSVQVQTEDVSIVTPLGVFGVGAGGGVQDARAPGRILKAEPADVTQLLICPIAAREKPDASCETFRINSGRKLRIVMDGRFVQEVERNRIVVFVAPGSNIDVTDAGGPTKNTEVYGPARLDVEKVTFTANGEHTYLDLERSQGGITADIAFDHVTGRLKLVNGAQISRVLRPQIFDGMTVDDLPKEADCLAQREWSGEFPPLTFAQRIMRLGGGANNPFAAPLAACVKTAEADLGYLIIWPGKEWFTGEPKLTLYSLVWVR